MTAPTQPGAMPGQRISTDCLFHVPARSYQTSLTTNQARQAELELDTEHQGTEHRVCTGFDKVLTCGYRLSSVPLD